MAKINNLHIDFIRSAKENKKILDFLAISVFLKLHFNSSALHAGSKRSICEKINISFDKFKKLESSEDFGLFFERTEKLFVAKTLMRNGQHVKFVYDNGYLSIIVGRKKIYNRKSELKSYKEIRKLIQKTIVFINVLQQEKVAHPRTGTTGTVSNNSGPKDGAMPIFVGCSQRRMAVKSGMSQSSTKKLIKECVNDGMIWKVNRRNVALSTRGMSDEDAVKAVDEFFKDLDREEGTFYYRSKSGRTVYQQRSNIYGTFLSPLDGMSIKKNKKKSKIKISVKANEDLHVYDPDICDGIIMEDRTILPTGEILNRPRVPLTRIEKAIKGEKKLSASERRRLRKYYAIKGSMTKEQIKLADECIKEAMNKTWITKGRFISTSISIVNQVLDYQRRYNRTCKKMGLPIATFIECCEFVMNDSLLHGKDKIDVINLIGFLGIQRILLQILASPKGTNLRETIGQSLPGGL